MQFDYKASTRGTTYDEISRNTVAATSSYYPKNKNNPESSTQVQISMEK